MKKLSIRWIFSFFVKGDDDLSKRNVEHLGMFKDDGKAIFDVYCEDASGVRFLVEMRDSTSVREIARRIETGCCAQSKTCQDILICRFVLRDLGVDLQLIATATGLSVDEIQNL